MEIKNYTRTIVEDGEEKEIAEQVATYTGPEDEGEMNEILGEGKMDGTNYIGRKRCFRKGWSFVLPKAQEKPKVFRLVKDIVNVYDLKESEDVDPAFISIDFKGNKKGYVYKASENNIDFSELVEVLEEGAEVSLAFAVITDNTGWSIDTDTGVLTFSKGCTKNGTIQVTGTLDEVIKSATLEIKMTDELYNEINADPLATISFDGLKTSYWGTEVASMQSNMAVDEQTITGSLAYITEGQLVDAWGAGNFMAFRAVLPDGITVATNAPKVVCYSNSKSLDQITDDQWTALDSDLDAVFNVTKADKLSIKYTIDNKNVINTYALNVTKAEAQA